MKRKYLLTVETFYTDESGIMDKNDNQYRFYSYEALKKYISDETKKLIDEYDIVFNDLDIHHINENHIVVNIEGKSDYYEYSVHFKWRGD